MVALPTGAGKTVIFSQLAAMARRKVLVLAHRAELLHQAQDKLERTLQGAGVVDIEQASSRATAAAKVVVASLRSLHPAAPIFLVAEPPGRTPAVRARLAAAGLLSPDAAGTGPRPAGSWSSSPPSAYIYI